MDKSWGNKGGDVPFYTVGWIFFSLISPHHSQSPPQSLFIIQLLQSTWPFWSLEHALFLFDDDDVLTNARMLSEGM